MNSTTFIEVARYELRGDSSIYDRLREVRDSHPGETIFPLSWGDCESRFVSIRFLHLADASDKQLLADLQDASDTNRVAVIYTIGSDANNTLHAATFDSLQDYENSPQIETEIRFSFNLPNEDIRLVTIEGLAANYYWEYLEERRVREAQRKEVWGL